MNSTRAGLPPGPKWPDFIQAWRTMNERPTLLPKLVNQYGDTFTIRMPYGPHGAMVTVVVLTNPEEIKQVFAGDPEIFHAGDGNASLLDLMGNHSLLLLDEADHARAKRLLMPAFSAVALAEYREMFTEIAARHVANWPVGIAFSAQEKLQQLTLEIIIRVVFGMSDETEIINIRPLVNRIAKINLPVLMMWRYPILKRFGIWKAYAKTQADLDLALYRLIQQRRGTQHKSTDLLSRLIKSGELTDAELRDQLITFLLAGHETTATSLSWLLHDLAHNQSAMKATQQHATDEVWLENLIKESLRLRPVIFQATRTLTQPIQLGGYHLPAGVVVSPGLGLAGWDSRNHQDPQLFNPERFQENKPASNSWIPFGGGARRCIGAQFSMVESIEILKQILNHEILPAGEPERMQARGIINTPSKGGMIKLAKNKSLLSNRAST